MICQLDSQPSGVGRLVGNNLHCVKENNEKCVILNQKIQEANQPVMFLLRCSLLCELDIALGHHALRTQPTDYSAIICRLHCFPELAVGF